MSASTASGNRRVAPKGKRARGVIDAPADPIACEESPLPGAATTSVRPPSRSGAPGPIRRFAGRFARTAQLAIGVAVVLTASIAVAWGARRYLTTSPRFSVRTVVVDGNHRRTAPQIAAAGGVAVGKNIFALDLAGAGVMIGQDPWVEKATVTRKLPATITINVVEREAAASVAIGGELYLATRDGDLFKKIAEDDPSDLPVVTGIQAAQVASDRKGVVLAVKRVLDVAADLDRSGVGKRYPIQELHLEKDGSLAITIGKEAIVLQLGQAPYKDKIAEASRVLTEVARRKANASVIFLDNDAHPERVVVRMR